MSIEVKNLIKKYNNNSIALNKVNMSIENGLYGLLGRNGSGKTTFIRILTTLLDATSGEIYIDGVAINNSNKSDIKQSIGYLPQEFGFYKEFTIYEILKYVCILQNIGKNKQTHLIDEVLQKVGLQNEKTKKYKTLSGGMKRRVGLAQAIINNPKILIVDEPTAGVDPEERIKIRKLLTSYAQNNIVIFSTHIIEDIEYTCNKLAILDRGNLIFDGNLEELLMIAEGNVFEYTFNSLEEFQKFDEEHTVVSFKRDGTQTKAITIWDGVEAENSKLYKPSLEEAYVYITKNMEGKI